MFWLALACNVNVIFKIIISFNYAVNGTPYCRIDIARSDGATSSTIGGGVLTKQPDPQ